MSDSVGHGSDSRPRKRPGQAKLETSAGGVVYRVHDGKPLFLLIRDSYRNWGFPKGHLEDNEQPAAAAVREVREETGLDAVRLYNVTVQPFYLHMFGAVQLAIVFAAFVDEPADVHLGSEHQGHEWLSPHEASSRFIWPREKEALSHIMHLLAGGNAGPVEDVLRVF